jgi:hypothetical protein
MQARPIEILSITAGSVRIRTVDKPVVLITYRPDPQNSPASEIVAVTREQAARLREDIGSILDAGEALTWD